MSEQSEDSSTDGEDPVWYQFIVNDEIGSYAVIATWDEEYEVFYVWTPDNNTCRLTPDWKTDNKEDNIWGFYVSYEEGYSCRFIEENGWSYAGYTYDNETMDPVSIVGPWGNEWSFISPEDFEYMYPEWYDEFNAAMRGQTEDSSALNTC
jgi:hypothetical protein